MSFSLSRRQLLLAGLGAGSAIVLRPLKLLAAPRMAENPFTLGVASGEPQADRLLLWTRLAPEPLAPDGQGGMPDAAVEVKWEIAEDQAFRRIVRRGTAFAHPDEAHSLHVEVAGLRPARDYWYRFHCGGQRSQAGRSRTAPAAGSAVDKLTFAYASCQNFEQGYYTAYRKMALDAPDLILHLGDYIYEGATAERIREHEALEPTTLAAYRNRYARYKMDADLQAAHACAPWMSIWDDHEVDNDYAGDFAQSGDDPAVFHIRRAAAYRAYWEHLPLTPGMRPVGVDTPLYRSRSYGKLLNIFLLDTRQYRSVQVCGTPEKRGGQVVVNCPQRLAPRQTMLGSTQEDWLLRQFDSSRTRWNLIAQQMLMAQFEQKLGSEKGWWTDGWDGYAGARGRILEHLHASKLANPVVIGGDIHSFWANDLKLDFDDPDSPTVASEFVGTSISSRGMHYESVLALLPENPHVKFFDSRQRGYARCVVTPDSWRTDFVAIDQVREPGGIASILKSFAVEPGKPGVHLL